MTTTGEQYARNYYEVSLDVEPHNETVAGVTTSHFALERNHYYVINATINALGGDNPQTVVTLDDIEYEVYPWDEKVIEVGGNASAKYLTLNTYHFEMHNESVDDYTLKFASSSPIESVTLKEAYYYNKYGNRINLSSGDATDRGVVNQIEATASADVLTGGYQFIKPYADDDYSLSGDEIEITYAHTSGSTTTYYSKTFTGLNELVNNPDIILIQE